MIEGMKVQTVDAAQKRLGGAGLKINDAYIDRSELLESLRSNQLDIACISSYGKDSILQEFDTFLLAGWILPSWMARPLCCARKSAFGGGM